MKTTGVSKPLFAFLAVLGLLLGACAGKDTNTSASGARPSPPDSTGASSSDDEDFEDVAPAIIVHTPHPAAEVSSPVTISGTANVFEATVSIRILDANGAALKEAFTTATCGSGCRGDYETTVRFSVDRTQDGTVIVYESSAEDGRPINVVKIPVMLTP